MEMKIEGNGFWVLRNSEKADKITIYDGFEESVKGIKSLMEKDVEMDKIEVLVVTMEGEQFSVSGVPWKDIAKMLVKV